MTFAKSFRDHSNVFRMFWGTNVLTMAWIVSMLGIGGLAVSVVFVAAVVYRSILALIRTRDHFGDERRDLVAFGAIGERASGSKLSLCSDLLTISCQFFGLSGYAIFAGKNLNSLVDDKVSYNLCVVICSVTGFLLSLLQTPLFLSRLSVVTNSLMFAGAGCILTQLRFGNHSNPNNGDDLLLVGGALDDMIGVAALSSALGGVTTALDVARTMDEDEPGRFQTILRRMMVTAVAVLTLVGILSYVSFRDNTCSVLSLSLPAGTPRKVAEFFLSVGCTMETSLNGYQQLVIVTQRMAAWKPHLFSDPPGTLQFVVMRIILFICTSLIAVFVPFYGLIASLNGAIGYGAMNYIVPPLLEWNLIAQIEAGNDPAATSRAREDSDFQVNTTSNQQQQHQHHQTEGYGSTGLVQDENCIVGSSGGETTQVASGEDKDDGAVRSSRKCELIIILVIGAALCLLGGAAAVRQIVVNEESSKSSSSSNKTRC